jgi:hypothetical protein
VSGRLSLTPNTLDRLFTDQRQALLRRKVNMSDTRVIVYHKHPSSARTLFLRVKGTVCLFEGLPDHTGVIDAPHHPTTETDRSIVSPTEQRLGLPEGSLEIETEFLAAIETDDSPIPTYLARLKGIDPPVETLARQEGELIAITQARTLPTTELKLLQLAYSFIME